MPVAQTKECVSSCPCKMADGCHTTGLLLPELIEDDKDFCPAFPVCPDCGETASLNGNEYGGWNEAVKETRMRLIAAILDKILPVPKYVSLQNKKRIDSDRQLILIRSGYDRMSLIQLRRILQEKNGMMDGHCPGSEFD